MERVLRTVLRVCPIAVIASIGLAGQTPSPQATLPPALGTGAISGAVIDGTTGAPMSQVIVRIAGATFPAGYQQRQLSDDKGRFVFQQLPDADDYTITSSRFGYFDGGYGRDAAPADTLRPIVVSGGAWVGNLKVPIWRPATISGSVRDEAGEPVVGVFVRVLGRIRMGGSDALAAGPITVTDDRGQYRLSGLMGGKWLVEVPSVQMAVPAATRIAAPTGNSNEGAMDIDDTSRLVIGRYPLPPPRTDGRAMAYGPAFHPAESSVAQASVVELTFGEDRSNVDVALAPVAAVRVSGVVEGPQEALANLTLRLLPAGLEDLGWGSEVATALVAPDGAFTFLNVPAGAYTLDAPRFFNEFAFARGGPSSSGGSVGFTRNSSFPFPPTAIGWSSNSNPVDAVPGLSLSASDFRNGNGPSYSGRMAITVGASALSGVTLKLRPALALKGRVVMESDPSKPPPATPARMFLSLDPAGAQARLGAPRSNAASTDGSDFEIPGVQPGEYWLRARGGEWLVKSVLWHGRDYAAAPLILDTSASDDLSGVVVTVTSAVPTLAGSVRSRDGSAAESGLVIAFPVATEQRVNAGFTPSRIKATALQNNGTYRFRTLPAGEYFVAAIDRSKFSTWREPEFLSAIERQAQRVVLHWGQTTNQDVTLAVIR